MSGEPLVLAVGEVRPVLLTALRESFATAVLPRDPVLADEMLRTRGDEVRVVVTASRSGVPREVTDRLPRLGAICNFGVGLDRIDLADAAARGVGVSTTQGLLDDCVADVAVAMVLDLVRELPQADAFVRAGRWRQGPFPPVKRIRGTRVGILGLGGIGRAVAARLEPFGVEIGYHSRHRVEGVDYRYEDSALELARWAEVLVVAVAGTPQTAGIVSAEVLDALGEGWLVNVARGACVDQQALIDRLASGRLRGAGLDVYAREPDVPAELVALPTTILLPHLGPVTHETYQEMCDLVVANVGSFLRDGTLVSPVALPTPTA